MATLWKLLIAFLKVGCFAYGGGPSMVPLIQQEAVEENGWYTNEQFADLLGMGNALPGPIATKLSAAIGYKAAGVLGAIVATTATVVPSALVLVCLALAAAHFKDHPRVAGAMKGVRPTVVALMVIVAWDLRRGSFPGWPSFVIFAASLLVGFFTPLHPAVPIIAGALLGAFFL